MLIIYKKRNGEIIERIRNTYCPYRVGDTTSMGWQVLDIRYPYKGKYYSCSEYDKIIDNKWKKRKDVYVFKNKLKEIYKNLNHITLFIVLMKIFIILSNKPI